MLSLLSGKQKKINLMKWIRTPKEIWDQLSKEFNFTVDACASHNNHLLDKYWTKEDDALKQDWTNEIVYCHPMYDQKIPKYIKKAFESNSLCVFLLPASTNSRYFHEYLWCNKEHKSKQNVEIRFLPKAVGKFGYRFANDNGDLPETGYLRPLMIVIIHNTN
jgi:site-specific DNA-methyltransferase (adenine-specific)